MAADDGNQTFREQFQQLLVDEGVTVRAGFLRFIDAMQSVLTDAQIQKFIDEKDLRGFLAFASDYIDEFAATLPQTFIRAATAEIDRLSQPGLFGIGKLDMAFDPGAPSAEAIMRANRLRFIKDFTANQKDAVRSAIADALSRGEGPAASARAFRDAIGLTESQVNAVNSYQALLENGSKQALDRQLRDRRFDSTITNTIENDDLLTGKQIERMVQRYAQNMLRMRSEVIARTETMRALNQAKQIAWAQMAEQLDINPKKVERTWITTIDGRERDTHHDMNRQTVIGLETPFQSPSGEELLYPGDPSASAAETIQCRCTVIVKFPFVGRVAKAFNPDEPRDDHGRWTDMFHGSPREFDSFEGKHAFFTKDENVATQYSRGGILGAGKVPTGAHKPTVYRVKVDPGNTFDLRNADHRALYNSIRSQHNASVTDPDERLPRLESEGFIQRGSGLPGFGHATHILDLASSHGFSSMAVDEGSQGHSLLVREPSKRAKITSVL